MFLVQIFGDKDSEGGDFDPLTRSSEEGGRRWGTAGRVFLSTDEVHQEGIRRLAEALGCRGGRDAEPTEVMSLFPTENK